MPGFPRTGRSRLFRPDPQGKDTHRRTQNLPVRRRGIQISERLFVRPAQSSPLEDTGGEIENEDSGDHNNCDGHVSPRTVSIKSMILIPTNGANTPPTP